MGLQVDACGDLSLFNGCRDIQAWLSQSANKPLKLCFCSRYYAVSSAVRFLREVVFLPVFCFFLVLLTPLRAASVCGADRNQ